MGIFQPGDKITRQKMNFWWLVICKKYGLDPNGIYTVHSCDTNYIKCIEWLDAGFVSTPGNFTLFPARTKEEIIAARIKKLYSKCKTTAHWV